MASLSPVPDSASGAANPHTTAPSVSWQQVMMTFGVLFFTGWALTRGYPWYEALLIASGAVTVATGLAYVPRGIVRLARAISRDED